MKKKKNIKGKRLKPSHLQAEVLRLLKLNPKKQFNPKQVVKLLKIDNNAPAIQKTLDVLVNKQKVISLGNHKYQFNKYAPTKKKSNDITYEGIVDMTRSGAAFITCEHLADDVFVAPRNLNSAQNGDRVLVAISSNKRSGRRAEGYISKILERATEHFIGTIKISKKFAFVIPDMSNMSVDIFVPLANVKDAKDGDKVVVKVIEWSEDKTKSPVGKVTSVLGASGSSDIAMKSILINNGFELEFPEVVMQESEAIALEIPEEEIQKRRDMREITTFTIDPDTAKDFDDALSIQWLENGHCEIGVHIADVTHYVRPDSPLDKEAFNRSTSVYLVDRVLPMLPEKLSNGVCSLRPNEDKLTFSAIFEFDKNDKIVNKWFGKTVIHSDRRFTYEEAQEVIETGEGDFKDEIKAMNRLALKLRKAKFKNGAISFESDEVKFKLDEEGKPLYVYAKERKEAHMLIEDFMLLANKEVAKYIAQKGKKENNEIPYVYRIHDSPDPGKLSDFALFAKSLGYGFDMSTPKAITNSFNTLAEKAKNDGGLKILEPLAIRTMSKAEYSTNNIGHYGLAFEYYAHFTSPIRRYADVLVHRLLFENLDGSFRVEKELLETSCKHISKQERKAMAAERESVKYKQVEFLKDQIGNTFEGIVVGMIDGGFFVQMNENKCEGMVRFESLEEPYTVTDGRLKAVARYSGDEIKMGDTVLVKVLSADIDKRQIELELMEE